MLFGAISVLTCSGCGYQWLTAEDQRGRARLGVFTDHTGDGSLGAQLRQAVAQLLHDAEAGDPVLHGAVRPVDDVPVGFDGEGVAGAYRARVQVELWLMTPEGALIWSGTPINQGARYFRAPSPVATLAARRQALASAVDLGARQAMAAFIEAGPRP